MPLVRVLLPTNLDGRTRLRGETVEVSGEVASYLREQGRVELVRDERMETPEGRAGRPETASRRPRK